MILQNPIWAQIISLLTLTIILFFAFNNYFTSGAAMDDPCIAALCMANSTCIGVPNPETCKTPETCEMMAVCIPTGGAHPDPEEGPPGPICAGEQCKPGELCQYAQLLCLVPPCPWRWMCVPPPGRRYRYN